jgi:dihydroorotate dehydrogenase electron transfer subunit
MHTGKGRVAELFLQDELRHARITCPADLIPSPGQYLLAGGASDAPLPVPLFYTDFAREGFLAAPSVPDLWNPGQEISLRGPFGRGFTLPATARKIGLVAFDDPPVRLRGLIRLALNQGAAIVLSTDSIAEQLPDEVEVQPLSALDEIMAWAEYSALDMARENLLQLSERLNALKQTHLERRRRSAVLEAEVLIRTPVPCGGIAECGVCAVRLKSVWGLACKDGPVFRWGDISAPR